MFFLVVFLHDSNEENETEPLDPSATTSDSWTETSTYFRIDAWILSQRTMCH